MKKRNKNISGYMSLIFSCPSLVFIIYRVGPFFGFSNEKNSVDHIGLVNIVLFFVTIGVSAFAVFLSYSLFFDKVILLIRRAVSAHKYDDR